MIADSLGDQTHRGGIPMAELHVANPPVAQAQSGTFDELIFSRDLNEVHLLLDYISGRPDVHISEIGDIKFPNRLVAGSILSAYEVLQRICEMRYPPQPALDITARADNAALLLSVKDKLNAIAYPASGVTIAYTYIFLAETDKSIFGKTRQEPRQTRGSVAQTAYPGLITSAKRFRWFHKGVARVGAVLTLFAALLLWIVVFGVQVTSRFEEDQKSAADLTNQIYAQADKENAALPAGQQTHDPAPVRCSDEKIAQQSNPIKLLCNQWSYYQARYDKSISDAASFANHWPSKWLMWPFPTSHGIQQNRGDDYVAKQENIQSITLVLSAYASYVLPVVFGVVGTIASFLRDIGNRITCSLLAPRDETLGIIRLIIGAIAGLAVGLFFTPASVAAQVHSGAGVLTLSASAIAFLAGYGGDGFFRMIDAMIVRVFSLDPPSRAPVTR
ncbi:hypothetical protein LMG28614_03707 [Paraburkholderia ultramafica]|uniref:Uncharacterized protein n=1 Tax=Paraburkholderia ultramafica TaxID=1544867 RepID=A0A6S7BJJ8_9BURK|nr:hypothetical protein [Paraburkholderia ultramafica]CAB3793379.1 hypothetical protein LMG28614_03707 [Paraburkholderia ultramafica]